MISKYLGFDSDYIIIGLCGVLLILFILTIVNIVQMKKLKKNYRIFMSGKDAILKYSLKICSVPIRRWA